MPDAMIDTAIIVDLIRQYMPAMGWLRNQVDQMAVRKLMEQFEVVALTEADQKWAMANYAAFKLSHGVGMYDALIAAPAHRLGILLYTHNLKHIQPLLPKLAQKPY